MKDMVLIFMQALRSEFESVPVLMHTAANNTTQAHIQIDIKRWVQAHIGSEVTLTTTYVPNADQPMPNLLAWLQQFYAFIQADACENPRLSWQGKTAEFLTNPMRIQCEVILRYEAEVE